MECVCVCELLVCALRVGAVAVVVAVGERKVKKNEKGANGFATIMQAELNV